MSPLPKHIMKHLPSSTKMDDNRSTSIDLSSRKHNMTLECDRLQTFTNDWPLSFLSANQMAAAGFYFLKKKEDERYSDDVKCIFCGIELGKWVQGDDPLKDHEKWSPNCWFLRRLKKGNSQNPGYDTCGSLLIEEAKSQTCSKSNQVVSSLEKLGIHKNSPPAYPHYASYESRLRSFDSWPISLRLKPNVLSEAGFFYKGKGDQTLCFRCGGGLKHWEENDDPWTEHARWFSSCPYVKLVKGQEFIHQVIGYKEAHNDPITLQDLKTVISAHSEVKPAPRVTESQSQTSTESSSVSPCSKDKDEPMSTSDGRLCKICYQREMGVVFLPCGHIVACVICASTLTVCAVCRQRFTATVRAFLS
uniref:Death-associated inhibitor of apoptosis 1 n=1 Tax=Cacopsylla melanoneura TaxID=428564 RepID=A0A8D8YE43_9HEMI